QTPSGTGRARRARSAGVGRTRRALREPFSRSWHSLRHVWLRFSGFFPLTAAPWRVSARAPRPVAPEPRRSERSLNHVPPPVSHRPDPYSYPLDRRIATRCDPGISEGAATRGHPRPADGVVRPARPSLAPP